MVASNFEDAWKTEEVECSSASLQNDPVGEDEERRLAVDQTLAWGRLKEADEHTLGDKRRLDRLQRH